MYKDTRRPCYVSERPITASLERSEPFHLLRLMDMSVPSLHIESTNSMIPEPTNALICIPEPTNALMPSMH